MKDLYTSTKQRLIEAPVPKETRTYKPVSHEELIDLTLNSIVGAGFTLADEKYSSARDGNIANGKFTLNNVKDNEMQIQIAFQNSYDKSLSLKFAIGARVFICSNGMVHGDLGAFKKKHQGTIQEFTPVTITEYIKRAGDIFTQMQKERDRMKNIELSSKVRAELIGRMFMEEDFITSTQLNIIKNQTLNPEYDYNAKDSLWELYQFTTQGMKDIHPSLWMENHMNAHKFFVNEAGILVPNSEITAPVPGSHPQANLFETA